MTISIRIHPKNITAFSADTFTLGFAAGNRITFARTGGRSCCFFAIFAFSINQWPPFVAASTSSLIIPTSAMIADTIALTIPLNISSRAGAAVIDLINCASISSRSRRRLLIKFTFSINLINSSPAIVPTTCAIAVRFVISFAFPIHLGAFTIFFIIPIWAFITTILLIIPHSTIWVSGFLEWPLQRGGLWTCEESSDHYKHESSCHFSHLVFNDLIMKKYLWKIDLKRKDDQCRW